MNPDALDVIQAAVVRHRAQAAKAPHKGVDEKSILDLSDDWWRQANQLVLDNPFTFGEGHNSWLQEHSSPADKYACRTVQPDSASERNANHLETPRLHQDHKHCHGSHGTEEEKMGSDPKKKKKSSTTTSQHHNPHHPRTREKRIKLVFTIILRLKAKSLTFFFLFLMKEDLELFCWAWRTKLS